VSSHNRKKVVPRWQNKFLLNNFDDIWGMTTSSTLGMVGMDGPSLHGSDGIIDKARFVQRIGMNGNSNIMIIGKTQTCVNGRWRSTPILVELQKISGNTSQNISKKRKSKFKPSLDEAVTTTITTTTASTIFTDEYILPSLP
jgi:hypothetical protein